MDILMLPRYKRF